MYPLLTSRAQPYQQIGRVPARQSQPSSSCPSSPRPAIRLRPVDEHGWTCSTSKSSNLSQYYNAIVDVHFGPGRKLQSARLVMFLDCGKPGYHPGMLNSQMSVSDVLYILLMKRWTTYPTFSLRLFAKGNQVRQSAVHGSDFALAVACWAERNVKI